MKVKTKILFRSDTTENWERVNPVLGLGELGYDTTLKNFKIGDGETNWLTLDYFSSGGGSSGNAGNLPIGVILSSAVVTDDAGLLLLNGGVYSQDGIYAEFFSWLKDKYNKNSNNVPVCSIEDYAEDMETYGQCGKFVINDTDTEIASGNYKVGANSIKFPTITEFIGSNNGGQILGLAELDTVVSHNHSFTTSSTSKSLTGMFEFTDNNDTDMYVRPKYATGVFTIGNWQSGKKIVNSSGTPTGDINTAIYIDATHTHSGTTNNTGSNTKPKNIRYPYYIVVATGVKTDIEIDINNYVNDFNNLSALIQGKQDKLVADRIVEQNTFTGENDTVVQYFVNGSTWYRIWASGWKECGFSTGNIGASSGKTLTLPVTFSTVYYSVSYIPDAGRANVSSWIGGYAQLGSKTVNSFYIKNCVSGGGLSFTIVCQGY